MISPEEAEQIAREWLEAFNSRDLDRITAHYAEDVELTSPTVVRLLSYADGTVRGKENLRAYFERGLAAYPQLQFDLVQVLAGVNSVTVYYRNDRGMLVAEVMVLDSSGKIAKVMVHHATSREAP